MALWKTEASISHVIDKNFTNSVINHIIIKGEVDIFNKEKKNLDYWVG